MQRALENIASASRKIRRRPRTQLHFWCRFAGLMTLAMFNHHQMSRLMYSLSPAGCLHGSFPTPLLAVSGARVGLLCDQEFAPQELEFLVYSIVVLKHKAAIAVRLICPSLTTHSLLYMRAPFSHTPNSYIHLQRFITAEHTFFLPWNQCLLLFLGPPFPTF